MYRLKTWLSSSDMSWFASPLFAAFAPQLEFFQRNNQEATLESYLPIYVRTHVTRMYDHTEDWRKLNLTGFGCYVAALVLAVATGLYSEVRA